MTEICKDIRPFRAALEHTLSFEGGYANHPADTGGETFRGISRRNWPAWPGWDRIDKAKLSGLMTAKQIDGHFKDDEKMKDLVTGFYFDNFWRPFEKLEGPERLQAKLFDTAVNLGVGGAVKVLQRAVNECGPISQLTVDGAVGPRTMAAFDVVSSAPGGEDRLMVALCEQQAKYYRNIVSRNSSQAVFLNGWLRRAAWTPE